MAGEIFNLDKIITLMQYIVPGFILVGTHSYFYLGRIEIKDILLKALIASVLFHSVFINPLEIAETTNATAQSYPDYWFSKPLINAALYFVIPTCLGVLTAFSLRENWIGRSLSWTGISTIHPTPSAWDWKFRNTKDEHYLIVTLKDGTEWYGLFGANSFVSSSMDERDIFLEQVYTVSHDGAWIERNSSVLIASNDIRSIEFFKA